jgi:quercetin dioxygenase-like cupin family protein
MSRPAAAPSVKAIKDREVFRMHRSSILAVLAPVLTLVSMAAAQERIIAVSPGQLAWQAGPPSLPRGAQAVVLEGDLSKEGPFTMRLKLPAGFEVAAHSHPGIEHLTVISGTFNIGEGDRLDKSRGTAVGAGGFVVMPGGHRHYVWFNEETVLQLHGTGPWGVTYVNPADDPRNR